MQLEIILVVLCASHCIYAAESTTPPGTCAPSDAPTTEMPVGCVCGVFLSGQFKKGSKEQPKGNPALLHEHPDNFACSIVGNKLCTNKCLDTVSSMNYCFTARKKYFIPFFYISSVL